ncbi:MAG: glycosyltransferase family 9 protein, partial [Solirubrobacterales bacterium]|nr:glycosyltransferase family 9 protein [Solirubrobacterales bacterium]
VVHPGATDERRRWPPERFAAVGDALAADGLQVVVVGVEAERDAVRGVVRTMRAGALALVDALSLGGLAGLLQRAAVVVANDSGPLHLAHAVGTPTAGVYLLGNLVNGAEPFRARHRPFASFRTACPVCGAAFTAPACEHRMSFVADVEAGAVLAGARDLLELARSASVA